MNGQEIFVRARSEGLGVAESLFRSAPAPVEPDHPTRRFEMRYQAARNWNRLADERLSTV